MPISRNEFLKKTDIKNIVRASYKFLKEHSDMAYTSDEIAKELDIEETRLMAVLDVLSRRERVKSSLYKGTRYFTIAEPKE